MRRMRRRRPAVGRVPRPCFPPARRLTLPASFADWTPARVATCGAFSGGSGWSSRARGWHQPREPWRLRATRSAKQPWVSTWRRLFSWHPHPPSWSTAPPRRPPLRRPSSPSSRRAPPSVRRLGRHPAHRFPLFVYRPTPPRVSRASLRARRGRVPSPPPPPWQPSRPRAWRPHPPAPSCRPRPWRRLRLRGRCGAWSSSPDWHPWGHPAWAPRRAATSSP
mmetsp:Transcript_3615/g.15877  ORF Transcript_3615/g.15877 Transcript_3615/m.15877 type:complete len:221 (-) Transcript_3615:412-1074(-)